MARELGTSSGLTWVASLVSAPADPSATAAIAAVAMRTGRRGVGLFRMMAVAVQVMATAMSAVTPLSLIHI